MQSCHTLYGAPKTLSQAVKPNADRFSGEFMFQQGKQNTTAS
ncbi:hypothetical protein [Undibacterium sp. Di24W]